MRGPGRRRSRQNSLTRSRSFSRSYSGSDRSGSFSASPRNRPKRARSLSNSATPRRRRTKYNEGGYRRYPVAESGRGNRPRYKNRREMHRAKRSPRRARRNGRRRPPARKKSSSRSMSRSRSSSRRTGRKVATKAKAQSSFSWLRKISDVDVDQERRRLNVRKDEAIKIIQRRRISKMMESLIEAALVCSDSKRVGSMLGNYVGRVDYLGATALWRAAHDGCVSLVRLLLEMGANPDFQCVDQGFCPSEGPSAGGGFGSSSTALHIAVARGHVDVVSLLRKAGADPDLMVGNTRALHLAAMEGNWRCFQSLMGIIEGLDPCHLMNVSKEIPGCSLHGLPMKACEIVADYLLYPGADPYATDSEGRTAEMVPVPNSEIDKRTRLIWSSVFKHISSQETGQSNFKLITQSEISEVWNIMSR